MHGYRNIIGICSVVLSVVCMYFVDHNVDLLSENQFMLTSRTESIEHEIHEILKISIDGMKNRHKDPAVPSFVPQWLTMTEFKKMANKSGVKPQFHKIPLVRIPKCTHAYTLIILVQSRISHFSQRMVIRNTWGKNVIFRKYKWRTFFLVAKSKYEQDSSLLYREFDEFNDLLIGDLYEDFYTLSLKLQMGFEWSVMHCNYKYLLKADDDVFVNIQNLFRFIDAKSTPKTKLYAGNVQYAATVFRSGRYGVSIAEYQKKLYPRYCSGGGFILSVDVVRKMMENFANVIPMKIDDAYVGELALKSGVDVLHVNMFRMYEKCEYNELLIVHHPVKGRICMEKLFEKHVNLQSTAKHS